MLILTRKDVDVADVWVFPQAGKNFWGLSIKDGDAVSLEDVLEIKNVDPRVTQKKDK